MKCWVCKKEKEDNLFSRLICEDCMDKNNKLRNEGNNDKTFNL